MLDRLKRAYPILLLTAGHGAVDFHLGLLAVVTPGLAVYLDIPIGDLVLLGGIASLSSNAAIPLAGYVMQRINLTRFLWLTVAISTLPAFMGYASGFWTLAFLTVVGAAATGAFHPEAALTANDVSGEKAYLGVPLFMAGGTGVYAIGTVVSIKMTESLGFHSLFLLAAPGLLIALCFLFQLKRKKKNHPSIIMRPRSKRMTKVQEGSMSYWPLLAMTGFFCMANGLFLSLLTSHYELTFGPGARSVAGWLLMATGLAGALSSFWWSAMARKVGFYRVAILTQALACPLFALLAFPASPWLGFLVAIPMSLVSPMSMYPVTVPLARNAAGLTQAMRTGILMGVPAGLSGFAVMFAGAMLRRGLPSSYLFLAIAACSLGAVLLGVWQLLAARRARKAAR